MEEVRLFEYGGHWLLRRSDTPNLYIYWCRPGTRRVERRSTGTRDLEEAKRALIAHVEGRHRASRPIPALAVSAQPHIPSAQPHIPSAQPHMAVEESVPILEAIAEYIERITNPHTRAAARAGLAAWTAFCTERDLVYVRECSPATIDAFVRWSRDQAALRRRAISNGTINRRLDVLRAALQGARAAGKLVSVPTIKLLPKPPPRERFLNPDEAQRLLSACDEEHVFRFVLLSLHTLARSSAVLELRTSQVDLVWNLIDFLPGGAVQSNKRRSAVPISATLRPHLVRWVAESRSGRVIEYRGQGVKSVKKGFRRACERAGLRGVSPVTLRHTGATLLAAAGVPLREISGMLGHTTTRMTEEVYAKRRPEFLANAVRALDDIFPAAPNTPNTSNTSNTPAALARQCAPNARQPSPEHALAPALKIVYNVEKSMESPL